MKHYKIVNKFRFITFVTVLILVISLSVVGVFGLVKARASEKLVYTEVEICDGDTIWQLAARYGNPEKDIREVIYDICSINNISADNLRAGQIVLIPEK